MRKKILSVALAIMALATVGATAQETITDKVKAKTEQIKNGTEKVIDNTTDKVKEVAGKVKKEVKKDTNKAERRMKAEGRSLKQSGKCCKNKCDSTAAANSGKAFRGRHHARHDGKRDDRRGAYRSCPQRQACDSIRALAK